MSAQLVRIKRLTRQPLRLGYTAISNSGDGSVVDLNSPAIARDFYRFRDRFVVLGPAESGFADGSANMDPNEATAEITNTQGTVLFTAIELGKGQVINGLTYYAGATPLDTGTYQKAGIYTSDGTTLTLAASSADKTNTAIAAKDVVAFSGGTFPYTTPSPAVYFAAIVIVATTAPTLVGRKPFNEVVANLGAPKQFATKAGTTLPATTTIASLAAVNSVPLITLT